MEAFARRATAIYLPSPSHDAASAASAASATSTSTPNRHPPTLPHLLASVSSDQTGSTTTTTTSEMLPSSANQVRSSADQTGPSSDQVGFLLDHSKDCLRTSTDSPTSFSDSLPASSDSPGFLVDSPGPFLGESLPVLSSPVPHTCLAATESSPTTTNEKPFICDTSISNDIVPHDTGVDTTSSSRTTHVSSPTFPSTIKSPSVSLSSSFSALSQSSSTSSGLTSQAIASALNSYSLDSSSLESSTSNASSDSSISNGSYSSPSAANTSEFYDSKSSAVQNPSSSRSKSDLSQSTVCVQGQLHDEKKSPPSPMGVSQDGTLNNVYNIFVQHARSMGACSLGPYKKSLLLTLPAFTRACRHLAHQHPCFAKATRDPLVAALVFHAFDENGDGLVDVDEFVGGVYLLCRAPTEEKARHVFRIMDQNQDGVLERKEVVQLFTRQCHSLTRLLPKLLEYVNSGNGGGMGDFDAHLEGFTKSLMCEATGEIHIFVDNLYEGLGHNQIVDEDKWVSVCQSVPELLEVMTADGLLSLVKFGSVSSLAPAVKSTSRQQFQ